MTYQTFIDKIRVELNDFGRAHRDKFDGDGSQTSFVLNNTPVKDGSYSVEVGGAAQTEGTDYEINPDTGFITFESGSTPAAGSDNIEVTYKKVNIRAEDYLEMINDAIDYFKWKLWNRGKDSSTITSVADQYEYDLSSVNADIIWLAKIWYKQNSSDDRWIPLASSFNMTFDSASQELRLTPPMDSTGWLLKFDYLHSFTKGSATSDTLDIPTKYLLPIKYYIASRYYDRLVALKVHETKAVTESPSFTPAQVMVDLSNSFLEKAELIAEKVKPRLPNSTITNRKY